MNLVAKRSQYKELKSFAEGYKQYSKGWETSHYHLFEEKKSETFKMKIFPDFEIEMPIEFKDGEITHEIQRSTKILNHKDNWDGDGAKGYLKETYMSAISFLTRYVNWVWEEKIYSIPAPKIIPGSNGAVDLYWKKKNFDLIISIPEFPKEIAHFYGDDQKNENYEGQFPFKEKNPGIFLSLLSLDLE